MEIGLLMIDFDSFLSHLSLVGFLHGINLLDHMWSGCGLHIVAQGRSMDILDCMSLYRLYALEHR
jgi:hypothetical protein